MSYPTNYIKYSDVESSIDLVRDGKNEYLHFITLSPLENSRKTYAYPNDTGKPIFFQNSRKIGQ